MRIALTALMLMSFGALAAAESAAGLEWTAAKAWTRQPDRPMRAATYEIPAAKGDPEPAELGVFYFGQGQGGSVDANVARWIGQFQQPDGSSSEKAAKTEKKKLNGLQTTLIDVSGNYLASMGPMAAGGPTKKENFRLLGAIVEGPQGAVFFKLVGPKKTVTEAKKDFDKLLGSVKVSKK